MTPQSLALSSNRRIEANDAAYFPVTVLHTVAGWEAELVATAAVSPDRNSSAVCFARRSAVNSRGEGISLFSQLSIPPQARQRAVASPHSQHGAAITSANLPPTPWATQAPAPSAML